MKRIQRQRTKGWRMPPNTVYVGRPTRWGNPWTVAALECQGASRPDGRPWDQDDVVRWFRAYAARAARNDPEWLAPLRGKDLACWCALDEPCHADVLLHLTA